MPYFAPIEPASPPWRRGKVNQRTTTKNRPMTAAPATNTAGPTRIDGNETSELRSTTYRPASVNKSVPAQAENPADHPLTDAP